MFELKLYHIVQLKNTLMCTFYFNDDIVLKPCRDLVSVLMNVWLLSVSNLKMPRSIIIRVGSFDNNLAFFWVWAVQGYSSKIGTKNRSTFEFYIQWNVDLVTYQ